MSQKSYRKLTHFLFGLLFLIFFLLYLLLSRRYDHASSTGGESGWRNRRLALGDVTVSDVRNSGFIVDEFPFSSPTNLDAENFTDRVLVCRTTVQNEGEVAVNIAMSVHGTRLNTGESPPAGLCCGVYHYDGGTDPVGEDYLSFLAGAQALPPDGQQLSLFQDDAAYPNPFRLEAGGSRELVLFFWVDDAALSTITDLDRDRYSVTVKLTSRAA